MGTYKGIVGLLSLLLAASANVILHQNYGIIFRPLPMQLIHGVKNWEFIFEVKFNMTVIDHRLDKLCDFVRRDSANPFFLDQCKKQDQATEHEFSRLEGYYAELAYIFKTRQKRGAVLQPVGDILGAVTGVGLQPDVDTLFRRIAQIDNVIIIEIKSLKDVAGLLYDMSDFNYKTLTEHIEVHNMTLDALIEIEEALNTVKSNLTVMYERLYGYVYSNEYNRMLLHLGSARLTNLYHYNSELGRLVENINLLSSGKLSHDLVSEFGIKNAVENINKALLQTNVSTQIAEVPLSYYYDKPIRLVHVSGTSLHIGIQLPLVENNEFYKIYKVEITKVPINPNQQRNSGQTQLIGVKEYLAVSNIIGSYIELDGNLLSECEKYDMYLCSSRLVRKEMAYPTCILGLFLDLPKVIHGRCEFRVMSSHTNDRTKAVAVNDTSYLVTTNEKGMTQKCKQSNSRLSIKAEYFVIHVPCGCEIIIGNIVLVNGQTSCTSSKSMIQNIAFTYNLPVLYHFDLLPETVSGAHVMLDRSTIKSEAISKLQEHIAASSNLLTNALDLKKSATLIKKHVQALSNYKSTMHAINSFSSHPIVELISIALSLLSLIISIYVWRRVVGLWTVFMFGRQTVAINITLWRNAFNSMSESNLKTEHLEESNDNELILLNYKYDKFTVFVIFLLVCYVAKRLFGYKCTSLAKHKANLNDNDVAFVGLKLYKTWNSVVIPLRPIHKEPNAFKIVSGAPTVRISLGGCLFNKLQLQWTGRLLLSSGGEIEYIELPQLLTIPFKERLSVWRALRDPNDIEHGVVIVHRKKHYQIPVCTESESTV